MQPPCFIAFTGVDHPDLLPGMLRLSARYPIEWGVLVDPAQEDKAPFPDAETRAALLAARELRWAAHVCGAAARAIVADPMSAPLAPAGVQRVQVNHGFQGSDAAQVAAARDYGRRLGVRTVLQSQGDFPAETGVDWLFDVSFGAGVRPNRWPAPPAAGGPFGGYSGGIGPDTVGDILARIAAPQGALYWIDMESGVRTDGAFDLSKCEAVCRAVYG
ncbi:phosphoribosylanthranilate isomerase [Caulobacter segnis]|uniref:phosphoribosylanthranilate isomerase n=1 Tax=Caulobacter segnis TaxID=88688 RepID=UPI001CBBD8CE|nr:phosphoribosylanthranilate isomerase [Caulobacter segnis]UAL09325.1 phosphoribosylanthranilate isomerase [Caulobacter segnis]